MADADINDKRDDNAFKGVSFSNYKKSAVRKELLNNIVNGRIEPACYWSIELICAGHYAELWEIILFAMSRHVHLGNPKLPIYIEMRMALFKDILVQGYLVSEMGMRNNKKIRRLFAEIITVLCISGKKHSFEAIKLNRKDEFDMTKMTDRLKAPHIRYAQSVFLSDDPKELFIAINELAYHLSADSKNIISACYWIEWILEFEIICRKKKEKCEGERRATAPVDNKYRTDIVWIIWDLFLHCSTSKGTVMTKIMKSLQNLFGIRYSPGIKKKRRYLLYFACALIVENVNMSIEMISNMDMVQNVVAKIDNVYKQVKKSEDAPKTDYLFHTARQEKSNLDKTIEKIEKMDALQHYIPRQ